MWFALILIIFSASSANAFKEPDWIWPSSGQDGELEVPFTLDHPTHAIQLWCIADFAAVDIVIDGTNRLTIDKYAPLVQRDLPVRLTAGEHSLVLRCRGAEGPSAIALSLKFVGAKSVKEVATSGTWSNTVSTGKVAPEFLGTGARRVKVGAFDDYEQWRDAPANVDSKSDMPRFVLPDGFRIDRIHRAAPAEGSWVSLAFDPQGRMIIAREDKRLLRLTPNEDGSGIERVETIEDSLKECRGLAFHEGSLFANANNSKALYRLRDTNGDDRFDERTQIRAFPGNVGHGRNDLATGPNNSLYSIHGDAVDLPLTDISDRTSPFRLARKGKKSNEGALLRLSPAKKWELVCAGLRNPFGVAFHPDHGEPFTYDADAEFDMGAPWYRPTRVLHLVSGADYGWRGVTGQWPPYFPDRADNAVAVCDIGKGSPTAVKFGTNSNFPPRYQRALYVLDWAYGRIVAVHLMPNGAGYRAQSELFARGTPLNVTDLDFGPDGAMYVVTGGRKTQSALYRLRYTGPEVKPASLTAQQTARRKAAAAARLVRRRLESFHEPNETAVAAVWKYLGHADPVLRHAARIALEHQPVEQWAEQATLEPDDAIRRTALMALARSDEARRPAVLKRLTQFDASGSDETSLLTYLQTYSLCLSQPEELQEPARLQSAERLSSLFPRPTIESVTPVGIGRSSNHELARLLVELGHQPAIAKAMKLLRQSTTQDENLHYLYILRAALGACTLDQQRQWFTALNDAAKYPGGRGLPGFIESMRTDAIATLSADQKKTLAGLLKPPGPATDEPLPVRELVREWKLQDFEDAALGKDVGSNRSFANGQKMFRQALCSRCHRLGLDGSSFGPDLTAVGSRFAPRDILQSIIKPSAVIAEPYRAVNIVTTAGKSYTGQILTNGDYRARKVRLVTDPLKPAEVVEIAKGDIEDHQMSDVSPMPMGLLNTLTRNDILDLLAYLVAGGTEKHSAFTSSK